jgi:adenylate cyclase class 2
MLEVEMKFPGADFGTVERRLAELRASADAAIEEADHYFNAPDRDFAKTDEALRLRRIGKTNRVTYKGPKQGTRGKTRTEIEVPLGDGDQVADDFRRVLVHLGYRPVLVVRKRRRIYHLKRDGFALEVALDEVDGLGRFAEVEIQAPAEQAEAAQEVLRATAAALGLPEKEERRSYLELLLAGHGQEGKTP